MYSLLVVQGEIELVALFRFLQSWASIHLISRTKKACGLLFVYL